MNGMLVQHTKKVVKECKQKNTAKREECNEEMEQASNEKSNDEIKSNDKN